MSQKIRLWAVSKGNELTELAPDRLDLESTLEDWLEADISVIDTALLVIGRQVPTDFGGYIDLLCLNPQGDTVIVELKRDKTPREITAQALDYASWVNDLSRERITDIANRYLGSRGPLEEAFKGRFGIELPDVLNESHQIAIVASVIDLSSERIIKYLSEVHGVNINAVTFQCFVNSSGPKFLARVFLIEPNEVELNVIAKSGSKRKPNLTYEQLDQRADEQGVGELYRKLVAELRPFFDSTQTTRSNIQFVLKLEDGSGTALNLIPEESDKARGVYFQLYSVRLGRVLKLDSETLAKALPEGSQPWKYYSTAPPEYSGFAGYFRAYDEAKPLIDCLTQAKRAEANGN